MHSQASAHWTDCSIKNHGWSVVFLTKTQCLLFVSLELCVCNACIDHTNDVTFSPDLVKWHIFEFNAQPRKTDSLMKRETKRGRWGKRQNKIEGF